MIIYSKMVIQLRWELQLSFVSTSANAMLCRKSSNVISLKVSFGF